MFETFQKVVMILPNFSRRLSIVDDPHLLTLLYRSDGAGQVLFIPNLVLNLWEIRPEKGFIKLFNQNRKMSFHEQIW